MPSPRLLGLLGGSVALLSTVLSHAQCAKDTDCKADRVCDAGKSPQAAPAAAAPPVQAPLGPRPTAEPPPDPPMTKRKMQRHSTGMMVGGIVMVSLTPVALVVAGVAGIGDGLCRIDHSEASCDSDYDATIYGALLSAVVLAGVGIPLLVIGAKKEPVEDDDMTATISPWATPTAAGVGLRIDL